MQISTQLPCNFIPHLFKKNIPPTVRYPSYIHAGLISAGEVKLNCGELVLFAIHKNPFVFGMVRRGCCWSCSSWFVAQWLRRWGACCLQVVFACVVLRGEKVNEAAILGEFLKWSNNIPDNECKNIPGGGSGAGDWPVIHDRELRRSRYLMQIQWDLAGACLLGFTGSLDL